MKTCLDDGTFRRLNKIYADLSAGRGEGGKEGKNMRSWNLTNVGIPNCVPEYFREEYETEDRLYQNEKGENGMKLEQFLSSVNLFVNDSTVIWIVDENEKPLCPCGEWFTDWILDYMKADVKKLTYEPGENKCKIMIKRKG